MALSPHKITALAESDATGTDGKNIVAGALVSLYDPAGVAVTLYDDENGTNGNTQKTTDATGQVVVYVTPGEYEEEINGGTRRKITVSGDSISSYATTAEVQALRPTKTGLRIENRERANAQYVLAPAGHVAQAGDITAANGRVWAMIVNGRASIENFGGGVSAIDNSQAWADLLSREVEVACLLADGNYKFLSSTTVNRGIKIEMGENSFIDCTDPSFSGGYWSKFQGSISQLPSLSVDASKHDLSLTLASSPDLSEGDVFIIFNPTDSSFSGFRANYKAGEFCKVRSVSGSVVNAISPLYDGYITTDVDLYKVNTVKVTGNVNIKASGLGTCLQIEYGEDCHIKANIKNSGNAALTFTRCFNCSFYDSDIHNEGDGGDDYGVAIGNSQHIRGRGGYIYSRRHSITSGGDNEIGAVPCRDLKYSGLVLANDINSGVFNADFHGNTERSEYINCVIFGGATWQGRDNGYKDCEIYNTQSGASILSSEILGGTFYIKDCSIYTNANPVASGRGVIDVGGNSLALTDNTKEDVTFEVKRCKINSESLSSSSSIVLIANRGSSHNINTDIDDIELNLNDFSRVLFLRYFSGAETSDGIIVDNVKSRLDGKFLAILESGYLSSPMRMQKQSGKQTVSSLSGGVTIAGAAESFKWIYPKVPTAHVSRNKRGFFGGVVGIPLAEPLTASGLTPAIYSESAEPFSASVSVDLDWTACISEI